MIAWRSSSRCRTRDGIVRVRPLGWMPLLIACLISASLQLPIASTDRGDVNHPLGPWGPPRALGGRATLAPQTVVRDPLTCSRRQKAPGRIGCPVRIRVDDGMLELCRPFAETMHQLSTHPIASSGLHSGPRSRGNIGEASSKAHAHGRALTPVPGLAILD